MVRGSAEAEAAAGPAATVSIGAGLARGKVRLMSRGTVDAVAGASVGVAPAPLPADPGRTLPAVSPDIRGDMPGPSEGTGDPDSFNRAVSEDEERDLREERGVVRGAPGSTGEVGPEATGGGRDKGARPSSSSDGAGSS